MWSTSFEKSFCYSYLLLAFWNSSFYLSARACFSSSWRLLTSSDLCSIRYRRKLYSISLRYSSSRSIFREGGEKKRCKNTTLIFCSNAKLNCFLLLLDVLLSFLIVTVHLLEPVLGAAIPLFDLPLRLSNFAYRALLDLWENNLDTHSLESSQTFFLILLVQEDTERLWFTWETGLRSLLSFV